MIQEVPSKVQSQHSVNILNIITALFLRDCKFFTLIVASLSQMKLIFIIYMTLFSIKN